MAYGAFVAKHARCASGILSFASNYGKKTRRLGRLSARGREAFRLLPQLIPIPFLGTPLPFGPGTEMARNLMVASHPFNLERTLSIPYRQASIRAKVTNVESNESPEHLENQTTTKRLQLPKECTRRPESSVQSKASRPSSVKPIALLGSRKLLGIAGSKHNAHSNSNIACSAEQPYGVVAACCLVDARKNRHAHAAKSITNRRHQ